MRCQRCCIFGFSTLYFLDYEAGDTIRGKSSPRQFRLSVINVTVESSMLTRPLPRVPAGGTPRASFRVKFSNLYSSEPMDTIVDRFSEVQTH